MSRSVHSVAAAVLAWAVMGLPAFAAWSTVPGDEPPERLTLFEFKGAVTWDLGNGAQLAVGCRPDDSLFVMVNTPFHLDRAWPGPDTEGHIAVETGTREVWSSRTTTPNYAYQDYLNLVGERSDGIVDLLREIAAAPRGELSVHFSGLVGWSVVAHPTGTADVLEALATLLTYCPTLAAAGLSRSPDPANTTLTIAEMKLDRALHRGQRVSLKDCAVVALVAPEATLSDEDRSYVDTVIQRAKAQKYGARGELGHVEVLGGKTAVAEPAFSAWVDELLSTLGGIVDEAPDPTDDDAYVSLFAPSYGTIANLDESEIRATEIACKGTDVRFDLGSIETQSQRWAVEHCAPFRKDPDPICSEMNVTGVLRDGWSMVLDRGSIRPR